MQELIYTVSLYLGMVGFLAFTCSFLTGMKFIKIKAKFRLHKRIGKIGFFAMLTHGLVMSYYYFFA